MPFDPIAGSGGVTGGPIVRARIAHQGALLDLVGGADPIAAVDRMDHAADVLRAAGSRFQLALARSERAI